MFYKNDIGVYTMENTQDVGAMITQLNDTLNLVLQKLDEHEQKLSEMDSVLYDGLIGPVQDQMAQQEYDQALSDFRCKYAEQLGPFEDVVKAIDDEDVYQKAFDAYNEGGFEASPDEYVTQLAESLKEQVAAVKGAVESITVEVETSDGETTTIETDGENVEVDSTDEDVKEEKAEDKAENGDAEEKPVEEEKPEEEKEEEKPEEEEEDDGESLEDFEKSLREELDKEKGPLIKQ